MADIDLHECIRATQRSLGRIVEHPRLSDALLARPPFRFLHDIVMQVIEITGFGKDIFTALECDSARVTVFTQCLCFSIIRNEIPRLLFSRN